MRGWLLGCASTAVLLLPLQLLYHVYVDRSGLPDLEQFLRFEPPSTGSVYDSEGRLLMQVAHEYRQIIPFEQIPPIVRDAVLSAEDKNFFAHRGVDYSALPRVALRNLRAIVATLRRAAVPRIEESVTFVQGGSTLTQQLVRGHFLTDLTRRENTDTLLSRHPAAWAVSRLIGIRATNKLLRKAEEIRVALWLEEALQQHTGSRQEAKEIIFARYANFIYLGHGRYGLAAASTYYFDKPLDTYTGADAADAALLAGIIKSPRYYAPTGPNVERALRRRNTVLQLLAKNGYLTAEQAQGSQHKPIELASPPESDVDGEAPAVIAHMFRELGQTVAGFTVDDLVQGRIRVHTTMDRRIQRIAEDAIERGLRDYERRHPKDANAAQASLVVLRNADGSVLAEVGGRRFYNGRSYRYTDFNRALQSLRQPGSALKPLVYLAAFRQGYGLDTYVVDEPIEIPTTATYEVKSIANYDGTFKGPITIRQALAESRNAATVWTARDIGMSSVIQTARDLGMHASLQPYLSTALGASEVTLVDLANLYRTLATGVTATPHIVEALSNRSNETVYAAPDTTVRLDVPELPLIQEALRGVVRLPNGTAHTLSARSFPIKVMGKTGTSSNFRDALFVGSTYGPTGVTVAVWIGHDDGAPLANGETGGKAALPVFREVMMKMYQERLVGPAPHFPSYIEEGIDAHLATGAAIRQEPPAVQDGAVSWTSTLRAQAFAIADKVRSIFVPPPVPNPASVRQSPTGRGGRQWRCTRMASGSACILEPVGRRSR